MRMRNMELIVKFVNTNYPEECDGLKCNHLRVEVKSGKAKSLMVLINYNTIIAFATTRTLPVGTIDTMVINKQKYSRTTTGIVNTVDAYARHSMDKSYEVKYMYSEEDFILELKKDLDNYSLDLDGNVLK